MLRTDIDKNPDGICEYLTYFLWVNGASTMMLLSLVLHPPLPPFPSPSTFLACPSISRHVLHYSQCTYYFNCTCTDNCQFIMNHIANAEEKRLQICNHGGWRLSWVLKDWMLFVAGLSSFGGRKRRFPPEQKNLNYFLPDQKNGRKEWARPHISITKW